MDDATPHPIADLPTPEAGRPAPEPTDLLAYLRGVRASLRAQGTRAADLAAGALNPLISDVRNHMTGEQGIDAETYLARANTPSWDPFERSGRGGNRR